MILFLVIGFFSLVVFDQGQDILRTLSFSGNPELVRHTWFAVLAVSWWSWQSFRASRVILHFSYFNFWTYIPAYSLRAQVLIPRLLATLPYFILAYAVYNANPDAIVLVALLVSSGIVMSLFLHFRKQIIVWIRSLKPIMPFFVPDYIPIKNGTYPAKFIWSKQRRWFIFRVLIVLGLFLLIYHSPVKFPQYLGSATVVLLGFGSWQILATVVSFFEKLIRFPVSFTILLLVVIFSFFNNNHTIRTVEGSSLERPTIEQHFSAWMEARKARRDTVNLYLVMAEGGGLRSAYWTSSVLNRMEECDPEFSDNIYAYSMVSGGALGGMVFHSQDRGPQNNSRRTLKADLLAPVTAALIFTDLLQKFIPFPLRKLDRAKTLESSFEQTLDDETLWQKGFATTYQSTSSPILMLNSTHVESGTRTVISNVDLSPLARHQVEDLFAVTGRDIPISTAIGISSRFPFITPPALVRSADGKAWGNLVDGGYYENLGMQTMLDLYEQLRTIARGKRYKVKFKFIAIRNTKALRSDKPVLGMTETLSPALTFSHIWSNNSNEVIQNGRKLLKSNGDELHIFSLKRDDKENIPLGWYLSSSAREKLDFQLDTTSDTRFYNILKK